MDETDTSKIIQREYDIFRRGEHEREEKIKNLKNSDLDPLAKQSKQLKLFEEGRTKREDFRKFVDSIHKIADVQSKNLELSLLKKQTIFNKRILITGAILSFLAVLDFSLKYKLIDPNFSRLFWDIMLLIIGASLGISIFILFSAIFTKD